MKLDNETQQFPELSDGEDGLFRRCIDIASAKAPKIADFAY